MKNSFFPPRLRRRRNRCRRGSGLRETDAAKGLAGQGRNAGDDRWYVAEEGGTMSLSNAEDALGDKPLILCTI